MSADALAKLTLPDGSSKTDRPSPSSSDLAARRDGGCTDIKIGARVSIASAKRNTSVVTYAANGHSQTYIVPNIDFQPVQLAATSRSFTVNEVVTAPGGRTNYHIITMPGKNTAGDPNMEIEATYNLNASSKVLLVNRPSDEPEKNLTGFRNLTLSPDNKTLYFSTDAWATSGAVHALNIATKKVSFVAPGNLVCVVLAGQFQGDLVIGQHRYFVQGGSYNGIWLYNPSGKELGLVSLEEDVPKDCATLGN